MTTSLLPVIRRPENFYYLGLSALALLSLFYLVPKGFATYDPDGFGIDFRTIWLAGKVWASGQNPYGPVFIKQYLETFGSGWGFYYWFYPPNWLPVALAFSSFPFQVAVLAWSVFNFSLLIAATYLAARALADVSGKKFPQLFLAGLTYACFMQATATTVYIGQTSILIYFGFSAIIFGILKDRPAILIVGLVFVALKPQIGVVAIAAIAGARHHRWTLLPTAGIGLVSIIPIIIRGDFRATMEGFFVGLSQFSGAALAGSNSPGNLTGLINILDYLSRSSIQPSIMTLVSGLTGIIVGFTVFHFSPLNDPPHADSDNARNQAASLVLLIAATFFIVPLHPYDHVALAALLMMILAFPFSGHWLIVLGLLISIRPSNLYSILGFMHLGVAHPASQGFRESLLMSAGLFLILMGALRAVLPGRSRSGVAVSAIVDPEQTLS
jgi:hypothetical protein